MAVMDTVITVENHLSKQTTGGTAAKRFFSPLYK